ncbi:MAG: energy transducer TonB [Bacteroidetes bacterium]|nr:energy transducer TonB [Bacteroidota bacterium]
MKPPAISSEKSVLVPEKIFPAILRRNFSTGFFLLLILFSVSSCKPDEKENAVTKTNTFSDEDSVDTFSVKRPMPLTDAQKKELADSKGMVDSIVKESSNIINGGDPDVSDKIENSKAYVSDPDVAASFPGGDDAMQNYLTKKIVYPLVAFQNDVKGTVVVKALIEADGRIGGVGVVRSLGYGCDESAMDCVRAMPKWIPATKNGTAVRTLVTFPVSFGQ